VRVDLDYFERYRSSRTKEQLGAILAELRAAREVVKAARLVNNAVDLIGTTEYSRQCLLELSLYLRRYDQAVGGGS
jgi:hypothetical protein